MHPAPTLNDLFTELTEANKDACWRMAECPESEEILLMPLAIDEHTARGFHTVLQQRFLTAEMLWLIELANSVLENADAGVIAVVLLAPNPIKSGSLLLEILNEFCMTALDSDDLLMQCMPIPCANGWLPISNETLIAQLG